ncbi:MAG: tRNA (adenosine(37)-N6)-threonylcarbamoyltransferase complex ATPase subunit type 1 TsaE [Dokdonella sp.]
MIEKGIPVRLDEAQLQAVARALASTIGDGGIVYLIGDLGAGKTTFARAMLQALGVGERVKSPTYSLIETYMTDTRAIHHLDLYRIGDPSELEWLGLADLSTAVAVMLVEWPQRGLGALPAADLHVQFEHAGERRDLTLHTASARGHQWLQRLSNAVTA